MSHDLIREMSAHALGPGPPQRLSQSRVVHKPGNRAPQTAYVGRIIKEPAASGFDQFSK